MDALHDALIEQLADVTLENIRLRQLLRQFIRDRQQMWHLKDQNRQLTADMLRYLRRKEG